MVPALSRVTSTIQVLPRYSYSTSMMSEKSLSRTLSALGALAKSNITRRGGGRGASFSTLASSQSPPFCDRKRDDDDENRFSLRLRQQHSLFRRSYHATGRNEIILPFLPEMVAFVFFSGGWTAYRTFKGKTITPDQAVQAKEAYRKHEEKLRRQWEEHELRQSN